MECSGGVRALSTQDQLNVLTNTREYLADDGNNPFFLMSVDIISGENEALAAYYCHKG